MVPPPREPEPEPVRSAPPAPGASARPETIDPSAALVERLVELEHDRRRVRDDLDAEELAESLQPEAEPERASEPAREPEPEPEPQPEPDAQSAILERLSGSKCLGFRAPYLEANEQTRQALVRQGFRYQSSTWDSDEQVRSSGELLELPIADRAGDYNLFEQDKVSDAEALKLLLAIQPACFDVMPRAAIIDGRIGV